MGWHGLAAAPGPQPQMLLQPQNALPQPSSCPGYSAIRERPFLRHFLGPRSSLKHLLNEILGAAQGRGAVQTHGGNFPLHAQEKVCCRGLFVQSVQTQPTVDINAENRGRSWYQQAWAPADSQVAAWVMRLKDAKGTAGPSHPPRWPGWPELPVEDLDGPVGSVGLSPAGCCENACFPGRTLAPTWRAAGIVLKSSSAHIPSLEPGLASSVLTRTAGKLPWPSTGKHSGQLQSPEEQKKL